jgi:hypothetical protein
MNNTEHAALLTEVADLQKEMEANGSLIERLTRELVGKQAHRRVLVAKLRAICPHSPPHRSERSSMIDEMGHTFYCTVCGEQRP